MYDISMRLDVEDSNGKMSRKKEHVKKGLNGRKPIPPTYPLGVAAHKPDQKDNILKVRKNKPISRRRIR